MDFTIDPNQMIAAADLADEVERVGGVPCQDRPDRWFPLRGKDVQVGHASDAGNAKKLCITVCPLVLHCRAYALEHQEMEGIWGGLSYMDRKLIWRSKGIVQTASRKGKPNRATR